MKRFEKLGDLGHRRRSSRSSPRCEKRIGEALPAARPPKPCRKVGGDRAVAALLDVLKTDEDDGVRCAAAIALGEIGDAESRGAADRDLRSDRTAPSPRPLQRRGGGREELGDPRAVGPLIAVFVDPGIQPGTPPDAYD